MKLLEGKTALITGASRGIGEAIAREFAEQGACVAFTFHSSEERALKLEVALTEKCGKAKAYKSDASSYEASEKLVNDVISDFGKIDIVVNNAGITRDNLILRMTEEQWDEVINTNLKSVFNMTRHVSRHMMRNRCGSIINISSIVGITGNPGQSNYAASKAGIIGFTKSIAREIGSRNIRCNAVAPGFIETEMTEKLDDATREKYFENIPLGRFGRPQEVAQVCVFLASDMSSYISGQTISVCGALNV